MRWSGAILTTLLAAGLLASSAAVSQRQQQTSPDLLSEESLARLAELASGSVAEGETDSFVFADPTYKAAAAKLPQCRTGAPPPSAQALESMERRIGKMGDPAKRALVFNKAPPDRTDRMCYFSVIANTLKL